VKAETVHAFALIGLRALADYDPTEFKRSTDLSKRHLDDRIGDLFEKVREEPEFDELQLEMHQLNFLDRESESQVASAFLLRQISLACLQRAQALAIGYHRENGPSVREDSLPDLRRAQVEQGQGLSRTDEYLRLGVMRLLRDLPQYGPWFNYRWKDHEIDCVLQPLIDEVPTILVEFKLILETSQRVQEALRQLRRASAGWDKSTLFVILTVGPNPELLGTKLDSRTFLLIYDPERDEFSYESAGRLVHATREWPRRGRRR
jgi:hypothetical protein